MHLLGSICTCVPGSPETKPAAGTVRDHGDSFSDEVVPEDLKDGCGRDEEEDTRGRASGSWKPLRAMDQCDSELGQPCGLWSGDRTTGLLHKNPDEEQWGLGQSGRAGCGDRSQGMQGVGFREWIGGGTEAEEKRDQTRSAVGGDVFLHHQNILSRYGNEFWSNGLGPAFLSKGGWSKGSEGGGEPVGLSFLRSWWGCGVALREEASRVEDGEGGTVWS